MSDHYFSSDPASEATTHAFEFAFAGRVFTFTARAGVFSKEHIDRGTRLLLAALPLPLTGEVLDLGCGYGPLGVVIGALSPEARLTLTDVNRRAVELAEANAHANGVDAEAMQSDGFAHIADRHFDWIVCNPPLRAGNAVVDTLLLGSAAHLRQGGSLVFVVRTNQGARSVAARVGKAFATVQEIDKGGGFRVYRASGPKPASGEMA